MSHENFVENYDLETLRVYDFIQSSLNQVWSGTASFKKSIELSIYDQLNLFSGRIWDHNETLPGEGEDDLLNRISDFYRNK